MNVDIKTAKDIIHQIYHKNILENLEWAEWYKDVQNHLEYVNGKYTIIKDGVNDIGAPNGTKRIYINTFENLIDSGYNHTGEIFESLFHKSLFVYNEIKR